MENKEISNIKAEPQKENNNLCFYSNKLRKNVNYSILNEREFIFFFSLIHTININPQFNSIQISVENFKKIMNLDYKFSKTNFNNLFKNTLDKIDLIKLKQDNEKHDFSMNLISFRDLDKDKNIITIKLNSDLSYLFKKNQANLHILNLQELNKIKGEYNIKIYEYLNRYNNDHNSKENNKIIKEISIFNFRQMLNLPPSYRTMNLKQQILNKAIKELNKTKIFSDLEFLLIKGKQNKIEKIRFIWTKQNIKFYIIKDNILQFKDTNEFFENMEFQKKNEYKQIQDLKQENNDLINSELLNKTTDENTEKIKTHIHENIENKIQKHYNNIEQMEITENIQKLKKLKTMFYYLGKCIKTEKIEQNKQTINKNTYIYEIYNINNNKAEKIKARDHFNYLHKEYKNIKFRVSNMLNYEQAQEASKRLNIKIHYEF